MKWRMAFSHCSVLRCTPRRICFWVNSRELVTDNNSVVLAVAPEKKGVAPPSDAALRDDEATSHGKHR